MLVKIMKKNMLILITFFLGLAFVVYSWFSSFPLSINSIDDSLFNHISIFYWLGLPLLLTSMFLTVISVENKFLKWMVTIGIVLTVYSLSFFYNTVPGVDEHAFRGLEENFIRSGSLTISSSIQEYYHWPLFFVFVKTATLITGLELATFEFLIYGIIGFLLATGVYIYASKKYPGRGSFAVIAFFMTMFYFLNFQAVPFSLAFGLLFILFFLTAEKLSTGLGFLILTLFLGITLTHAFVPFLFILYLFIRGIISKSRGYFALFAGTLTIYSLVNMSIGQNFLFTLIEHVFEQSEFSSVIGYVFQPTVFQFDQIAQIFSRTVTVVFLLLCAAGFVFLAAKRKLRDMDKAVFLTGVFYYGIGLIYYVLGSRAIAVAFLPVSLGIIWLLESRFKRYFIYITLILLVLFTFIPMHSSFNSTPIVFQTMEETQTANFMIENYNWNSSGSLLAHVSTYSYILPQVKGDITFWTDYSQEFSEFSMEDYNCIIYSLALSRSILSKNISTEGLVNNFNTVYNSGSSYIALRSNLP